MWAWLSPKDIPNIRGIKFGGLNLLSMISVCAEDRNRLMLDVHNVASSMTRWELIEYLLNNVRVFTNAPDGVAYRLKYIYNGEAHSLDICDHTSADKDRWFDYSTDSEVFLQAVMHDAGEYLHDYLKTQMPIEEWLNK